MENLDKTLEMMLERNLNVTLVFSDGGKVIVCWKSAIDVNVTAPTDWERSVAHECAFYQPTIHKF